MCPNQYALFRDSTPSSLILAIQQANSIHPEWFPFEQTFSLNHSTTNFPKFFSFILGCFGTLLRSASLRLDTNIWIFFKIFTKFDGIYRYLGFVFLNSTMRQSSEGFNPYFARTIQFIGFRSESYMLAVSKIVQTFHVLMMLIYNTQVTRQ